MLNDSHSTLAAASTIGLYILVGLVACAYLLVALRWPRRTYWATLVAVSAAALTSFGWWAVLTTLVLWCPVVTLVVLRIKRHAWMFTFGWHLDPRHDRQRRPYIRPATKHLNSDDRTTGAWFLHKAASVFEHSGLVFERGATGDGRPLTPVYPDIPLIRSTAEGIEASVHPPYGYAVADVVAAQDRIAAELGCEVRINAVDQQTARLLLVGADPLAEAVEFRPEDQVSAHPLPPTWPVALQANGEPLHLALTHTLAIGATGAGKGSVLWAIIRANLPAHRAGIVTFWGLDRSAPNYPTSTACSKECRSMPTRSLPQSMT